VTIARVQEGFASVGAFTDCTVTMTVTAGNTILLLSHCTSDRDPTTQDSQSNAYVQPTTHMLPTGIASYRFKAAPIASSGSLTVTIVNSASSTSIVMDVWELSGADNTNIFDVDAVYAGGGSQNITPVTDHAAIFAIGEGASVSPTPDSPLIQERQWTAAFFQTTAYQLDSGTATGLTRSMTNCNNLMVAAIRPAVVAGGSFPPVPFALITDPRLNTLLRM
jgi:hypothetical protein